MSFVCPLHGPYQPDGSGTVALCPSCASQNWAVGRGRLTPVPPPATVTLSTRRVPLRDLLTPGERVAVATLLGLALLLRALR